MQTLKRLFDFYIFSSIHVALGVFCFVKISLITFDLVENNTAVFCFFSTIVSYNFIRFLTVAGEKNWLAEWYVRHKPLLAIVTFVSAVVVMYLSFKLRFESLVILFPFFVLTLFYGMKLPKKLNSLRYVPGLKIFLIASCFSGVTVLFPLIQNEVEIEPFHWWYILQRTFFVILITLPFDIRDVDFDKAQLKTIPQLIGVKSAKVIGVVLSVGTVLIEYFFIERQLLNFNSVLAVSVLSVFFLLFSTKNQSKYYSAFWVESIPVIWFLLVYFNS